MTQLLSLQVGLPVTRESRDFDGQPKSWTSAIYKEPVAGPVQARATGLEGDGQANLAVHGGVDKAVNVYPHEHYAFWREQLRLPGLGPGSFGENFTTAGLLEDEVCIGDTFAVGGVVVQVSQPRQPCWKLALKWQIPDLARQVEQTGRTGWYFRVRQEGSVGAGDTFTLRERPFPRWTITAANEVMHHRQAELAAAAELAACPLLSASWQRTLAQRVTAGKG